MAKTFEYKFVRVGQYFGSALFGVRDKERETYQDLIHEHAGLPAQARSRERHGAGARALLGRCRE